MMSAMDCLVSWDTGDVPVVGWGTLLLEVALGITWMMGVLE